MAVVRAGTDREVSMEKEGGELLLGAWPVFHALQLPGSQVVKPKPGESGPEVLVSTDGVRLAQRPPRRLGEDDLPLATPTDRRHFRAAAVREADRPQNGVPHPSPLQ